MHFRAKFGEGFVHDANRHLDALTSDRSRQALALSSSGRIVQLRFVGANYGAR